jgi:hypothetical protein
MGVVGLPHHIFGNMLLALLPDYSSEDNFGVGKATKYPGVVIPLKPCTFDLSQKPFFAFIA